MVNIAIDVSDRKPLGKTGETVSAIGIGTWAIRDYVKAKDTILWALEQGIDNIDTAEMYDNGRAESFVGQTVREYGRDHVFITTKLMPHHFRDPHRAVRAARASLKRMNIDIVDLLLIHWPDTHAPLEVQIRSLEAIADAGLARYIGVSNFSVDELEKALSYTRKHDIVADQVHYSVIRKSVERDLLPYAIANGITLQAYTPLERGRVVNEAVVRRVAGRVNKPPAAVALNYLISKPRVVAIVKAERKDHMKEVVEALGWRLSEEQLAELCRI